jgi:hypothetical protein
LCKICNRSDDQQGQDDLTPRVQPEHDHVYAGWIAMFEHTMRDAATKFDSQSVMVQHTGRGGALVLDSRPITAEQCALAGPFSASGGC